MMRVRNNNQAGAILPPCLNYTKGNIMSIKYKYTIKDTDGTIHTFKTLKGAKESRIGYDDLSPITGGMRIIARVRIEPKTLNMNYWKGE
jgi:hypothetical protein